MNPKPAPRKERASFMFARHGHNLTGASPERSHMGSDPCEPDAPAGIPQPGVYLVQSGLRFVHIYCFFSFYFVVSNIISIFAA